MPWDSPFSKHKSCPRRRWAATLPTTRRKPANGERVASYPDMRTYDFMEERLIQGLPVSGVPIARSDRVRLADDVFSGERFQWPLTFAYLSYIIPRLLRALVRLLALTYCAP